MVERVLYSLPDHHNYGACHCQQNCLLWLKLCLVSVQGRSGQFIKIPRLINYTIDSCNTKKSLKCSPRQNQLHAKDAAFIRGQNLRQVKHAFIKKSKIYIYIFSLFDLKDEVSFLITCGPSYTCPLQNHRANFTKFRTQHRGLRQFRCQLYDIDVHCIIQKGSKSDLEKPLSTRSKHLANKKFWCDMYNLQVS